MGGKLGFMNGMYNRVVELLRAVRQLPSHDLRQWLVVMGKNLAGRTTKTRHPQAHTSLCNVWGAPSMLTNSGAAYRDVNMVDFVVVSPEGVSCMLLARPKSQSKAFP